MHTNTYICIHSVTQDCHRRGGVCQHGVRHSICPGAGEVSVPHDYAEHVRLPFGKEVDAITDIQDIHDIQLKL